MKELKDNIYEGYLEEKKSQFYSSVHKVQTEEEINELLQEYRKKHQKANHVVYAYRIGDEEVKSFCSDDGEPSQTSGAPMLTVLTEEGITNILGIVVRYFGGTKLGKGGLIRAYSGALKEALKEAKFKRIIEVYPVTFTYDYTYHTPIERLLDPKRIEGITYDEKVHVSYFKIEEDLDNTLINLTGGSIRIKEDEKTTIVMED